MESITKENGEAINKEVYSGWRYISLSADIKKSSKQSKKNGGQNDGKIRRINNYGS